MTKFDRKFEHDKLKAWLGHQNDTGIAALLDRWALPGNPAHDHGLRIAVRSGYLNFYVKGQSVAELRMIGDWPRLKVHGKYAAGIPKGDDASGVQANYVRVPGETLSDVKADTIDLWVRTAATYAGDEKRFVDDLVAANPGTIDLEMALPGDNRLNGKADVTRNVAPRMDLVALQHGEAGLELAFWEAKCADNGELRASDQTPAHVVEQLERYMVWLQLGQTGEGVRRANEVLDAYANAAALLEALAVLANKPDCAARDLWRQASQGSLKVVLKPGIVIGNYCAKGCETRTTKLQAKAKSFTGLHSDKLAAFTVVQYPDEARGLTAPPNAPLPRLTGVMLPA